MDIKHTDCKSSHGNLVRTGAIIGDWFEFVRLVLRARALVRSSKKKIKRLRTD